MCYLYFSVLAKTNPKNNYRYIYYLFIFLNTLNSHSNWSQSLISPKMEIISGIICFILFSDLCELIYIILHERCNKGGMCLPLYVYLLDILFYSFSKSPLLWENGVCVWNTLPFVNVNFLIYLLMQHQHYNSSTYLSFVSTLEALNSKVYSYDDDAFDSDKLSSLISLRLMFLYSALLSPTNPNHLSVHCN